MIVQGSGESTFDQNATLNEFAEVFEEYQSMGDVQEAEWEKNDWRQLNLWQNPNNQFAYKYSFGAGCNSRAGGTAHEERRLNLKAI